MQNHHLPPINKYACSLFCEFKIFYLTQQDFLEKQRLIGYFKHAKLKMQM